MYQTQLPTESNFVHEVGIRDPLLMFNAEAPLLEVSRGWTTSLSCNYSTVTNLDGQQHPGAIHTVAVSLIFRFVGSLDASPGNLILLSNDRMFASLH